MFGPTASPVVQRQRTWHIGPTTCVLTSRSTAKRESSGSDASRSHERIASTSPSIQRASAIGLARVRADEARRPCDPVGEHVRAEAARLGDRLDPALHRGRQPALGVRQRHEHLLRSAARLDHRARRRRARTTPSETGSGPATETGITAAPVSCSAAVRPRLEVDADHLAVEPEHLLARADRVGVVLAGPALHGRILTAAVTCAPRCPRRSWTGGLWRSGSAPRSPTRSQTLGGTLGLATVLVGDDPASDIYIRNKHKAAARGRDRRRATTGSRSDTSEEECSGWSPS